MEIIRKTYRIVFKKYKWATLAILALVVLVYCFCLPNPLFQDPTSTVIEDRNGRLLGARIAEDGQWRFPEIDTVPEKFQQAIIAFEDKRFYSHPGFDVRAFGRALIQNLKAGRVVSGGSTISMQVIRLSRRGKSRTIWQKFIELILATRLEIRFSKNEILALYASHAPFGGNVVGLETAAWRYFGKSPNALSWSEAATLAVLPNSPALIHPGRNRDQLFEKRNRLLKRLLENNHFDKVTFDLACQEPLPEKPLPLPHFTPHLLGRIHAQESNSEASQATRFKTTIDLGLQNQFIRIAEQKSQILKHNEIHNLAILVMEVKSGNVLSYIGNAPNTGSEHGQAVDIITAPRSTGSILKPFLYAKMIQSGELLPSELVPDIPTYLSSYRPQNYLDTYDGVVPADRALSRSLNIPFIKMLQRYGVERFHHDLNKLGLTTINRSPDNYGLTLILGGAEANLWDLTGVYASMARRLSKFYERQGLYGKHDFRSPSIFLEDTPPKEELIKSDNQLNADAIWLTFKAMQKVERPNQVGEWERFQSARKIAWKTGTSIGFRDAWAIGVTPEYAVGVWVGNADGEGRPGLVGVYAAAPLLFEIFEKLPQTIWFEPPYDALKQVEICSTSGLLAKSICPKDTIWAGANSMESSACSYHILLNTDESEQWRVNSDCYPINKSKQTSWFVLPTIEEHYYKSKHPNYRQLPPFHPDCISNTVNNEKSMALIYPSNFNKIMIPLELDGSLGKVVFQATHRTPDTKIHWHLDESYITTTDKFHSIELSPTEGEHWLTLVDETGQRLSRKFRIVEKKNR